MQKLMARFTDLQWQQSAEAEALGGLLKQERTDEAKAMAQLDKLLSIESDVKRLHISMLIKVKNLLTADQQAKLRELKRSAHPSSGGPQTRIRTGR
jgi:Spy/CpxP family protein refolding chaperone